MMTGTGKKQILIMEDDEEMRSQLIDFLNGERYETDSLGNGLEAFYRLAKNSFDLVITDIRMSSLTGLDILPEIRELQPEASIIVTTAFGSKGVYSRASGLSGETDSFGKF